MGVCLLFAYLFVVFAVVVEDRVAPHLFVTVCIMRKSMHIDRADANRRRETFIRAKYERQAWARAPAAAGSAVATPTPTPAPAPVAVAAPAPARAATANVNAAASLFAGTGCCQTRIHE
jgi:hypothetical protein